jgi:hypothetical protein
MQRPLLGTLLVLALTSACSDSSTAPGTQHLESGVTGVGPTRVMPIRGGASLVGLGGAGNPMIYHGGPILERTKVVAIYWSSRAIYLGGPTPGEAGPGTSDNSLVGTFLRQLGGSPYFNINTTYFDTVEGGHTVQNSVTYTRWWADNQNVPPTDGTPVPNSALAAEISRGFSSGTIKYDPATIYLVFTAGNTNLGGFFGTLYCGYHGTFLYKNQPVIYAALPFTNQYPAACSANLPTPNFDPSADRVVNIAAHEIEESTTDYPLSVWLTAGGQENADLCAFGYGPTYTTANGGVANMRLGGTDFLIQQNWLNVGAGSCAQSYGPAASFQVSCPFGHRCDIASTSTAPGSSIASYRWTIDGGTVISTAPSFTHTFKAGVGANLTLTVTDAAGLTNSSKQLIFFP